jgi:TatD DNase family protein
MKLFDSHCHLTDAAFGADVGAVLGRARDAGVVGMVTIASDLEDAEAAAVLAQRHDDVWCTAGVHPHVAHAIATRTSWEDELRTAAARERVVAIGETGLDYHYDNSPRDVQRRGFEAQLALASELELPVVVHTRDADGDAAAIIRGARASRGVLHCFTGGLSLMEIALEAGWFVSFAGLITFRNFRGEDVLRAVPDERLLLETDSPYLSPAPLRGKRNEPANVRYTCQVAARIRGVDPLSLGELVTRNAFAFYGLRAAGPVPHERAGDGRPA